jgi:hypothetical protein
MQARAQTEARTLDTRNKIQLGGLVVLAGLEMEDSAVLLGLLTLAARHLVGPDGEAARARFRQAGDQAFKARANEKLQGVTKLATP